ncbi:MAG: HAMP domain-containing histidine kinase [Actinobacteria bacterium]|nr:HAMP domain-containing histidine kinase [Actinomycetota bacterium]
MTKPTRRLRTRLLVAMVAIAFGVLVVAALGAAGLARDTSAQDALDDLERQAPTVSRQLDFLGREALAARDNTPAGRRFCLVIARLLRATGGSVVTVDAEGTLREEFGSLLPCSTSGTELVELPRNLEVGDLDTATLLAGHLQRDVKEDTAFVAEPITTVNGLTPVVVLTQRVETRPLGDAGPYLFGTGMFALIVAAAVAAFLARRLTRPIAAMQETAGRIAAGDLSARVATSSRKGRVGPNDELGSLADSIDAMADDLETARGHERAFLLSVSHDLRTPLTSIKGYAEGLADGVIARPDDRARAATVIATEARRLERLVADLLDLARLDTHAFSLAPVPIDARSVVGDAVEGFAPAAEELGVALHLAPGAPVPTNADPERLAQIVANLVENALKYAATSVTVAVVQHDGRIELRVDDDGPGIAESERGRVFERLYTARTTPGRKVGTGIGLAIVHELAVAMGGEATCDPLEAGGTRFVVRLPA